MLRVDRRGGVLGHSVVMGGRQKIGSYAGRISWVGNILTRARVDQGLSQHQIAAKLGVSRGKVEHVEAGRNLIRADVILHWCKIYGVDPLELLKAFDKDRIAWEE